MNHFKREAYIQAGIFVAILLLGVVAAMIVPRVLMWVEADKCLDAGGRYDRSTGVCIELRKSG